MSAAEATRVVVIKPGDALLIGNVGGLDETAANHLFEALKPLKDVLELSHIVVFEADIEIAVDSHGTRA